MTDEEKIKKLSDLAREVMELSRNTLLVDLRFLDMAVSRLTLSQMDEVHLATQGTHVFYNPRYVLGSYKSCHEKPVREYMHVILHCIFRHMFVNPSIDIPYWNLACDIAVEYAISDMNLNVMSVPTEAEQRRTIRR